MFLLLTSTWPEGTSCLVRVDAITWIGVSQSAKNTIVYFWDGPERRELGVRETPEQIYAQIMKLLGKEPKRFPGVIE